MQLSVINVCIILVFVGVLGSLCEGKRILLLPFPMHSHVSELASIGENLHTRGHEVYILMNPHLPGLDKFKKTTNLTVLMHHVVEPDWLTLYGTDGDDAAQFTESLLKMKHFIEDARTNCDPDVPGFVSLCTNPLSDGILFEKAKVLNFDLGIIDAFINTRCLYTLLYKLNLPYVSVALQYEPWLWRAPAIPSFVPFPLGTVFTEKMTFWERLTNTFYMMDWFASPRVKYLEDYFVSDYAPEKPFVTLNHLAGKSLLWLQDTDIVLDYARPSMPNVVEIGGLTTRPAEALSTDLEQWVSLAQHGVIVVSFGSFCEITSYMAEKFLTTFSRLRQRVIWRHANEKIGNVPKNVKLLKWLPQNDLLGHPNTKLFITHCGNNGQFESLYQSVPMIGFPVFGDQMYNSVRMQNKGFGIAMDLRNFTPETLTEAIDNILNNKTFYENIKKASNIYKDRRDTPAERAVYWIEHVMKYGGDHLHSHGLDLPWYQYLMLDIIAAVLFVLLIFICLIWRLCSFAIGRKKKEKQKQT